MAKNAMKYAKLCVTMKAGTTKQRPARVDTAQMRQADCRESKVYMAYFSHEL